MYHQHFYLMENVIQNFGWGSRTAFTQLFDIDNPQKEPQAELWMGGHPNGCSSVYHQGKKILLSDLIHTNKNKYLSEATSQKFGELPYLFKILAAENALSIQVHPSKDEAEKGFKKEELLEIPMSAGHRNFKDANHKPELVYALTNYQAMNGFRSSAEIITFFSRLDIELFSDLLANYKNNKTPEGLKTFFVSLLSFSGKDKAQVLNELLQFVIQNKTDPIFSLIEELSKQYVDDIGLFAPLFLNVITLTPGEAMFLDARTPHAYIKGTALEIMANSDNVLRAGLTPKHIDIEELVNCTLFEEKSVNTLLLEPKVGNDILTYPVPVPDFKFSVYRSPSNVLIRTNSAEILLPLDDNLELRHKNGEVLTLKKGQSVFIPAFVNEYTISSKGRVAKAYS